MSSALVFGIKPVIQGSRSKELTSSYRALGLQGMAMWTKSIIKPAISLSLQEKRYSGLLTGQTQSRKDHSTILNLSLGYNIDTKLSATLSGSLGVNNSNIPGMSYKKNVVALEIAYLFGKMQ